MILGALMDLGLDLEHIRAELRKVRLTGYGIEVTKVKKRGIGASYVDVPTAGSEQPRTVSEIIELIESSHIDDWVKRTAKQIFIRLSSAEARVHGYTAEKVHLHEVGATDTLVDVIGSLAGLRALGVGEVYCSPLNVGRGLVQCRHGWLPVPAPITAELVKGIPIYAGESYGELTTPTGAAIVTEIAAGFGNMPTMEVEGVGHGAGKMDLEIPNFLRVFLGKRVESTADLATESIALIETNIDDMNPQFYDHVMDSLLQAGALDVFLSPVQMKKNRPGVLLSVVSRKENVRCLVDIIVRETTTLGVRVAEVRRVFLPRRSDVISTRFGEIRIKLAERGEGVCTMMPEYEDCKKAARVHEVPLNQVYAEVQRAWEISNVSGGG